MKTYLRGAISEQINRGLYLKGLIPRPVTHAELLGLVERCTKTIDENIALLRFIFEELVHRQENDIRDIYRQFRMCTRNIGLVENYGIPALYYTTPEVVYLNKLVFRVHQLVNLPLAPPSVACISTDYYLFNSFTNVVFVPVGEPGFLLHLPDLFHEMGHEVLHSRDNELSLKSIDLSYRKAINIVTDYYRELFVKKRRETGSPERPRLIEHIHSQWKNHWMEEFFSDLFACFTLGPAYAWSHLHLTAERTEDVYNFSNIFPQRHPSDDSRAKMLIIGLNKLGFQDEAISFISKWRGTPFVTNTKPVPEYQQAYPYSLMEDIADLFLRGLEQSGFSIIHPRILKNLAETNVLKLLNEAWEVFWKDPDRFREWEVKKIEELKSVL